MTLTILEDLKSYNRKLFFADLLAGLTVAIILIPQGMAYSLLAGMPPIYGLYAALVPLVFYPIFASSRELSVGPVALMSIIILSGVSIFAEPGTPKYIDMVLMTGFLSGILQILYSVFKLGILSNFLSKPVMSGFISAAGVIIAISQIKYFLTLDIPRSTSIIEILLAEWEHLSESNLYSLSLGIGGIVVIFILKKIHRLIPSYLIAVLLGIIMLYSFGLQNKGVPIIGEIPNGLPSFYIGFWNLEYIATLLPASLIISVVCFIGSYSIAKTMALSKDNYSINPNKELLGLGIAKLVGSFFLAMPSTGSFTRSAVNNQAGSKTGLASIYSALFIGLTLAFFSSYFYYLPVPILAAIVITSVFSLIDWREARKLYFSDRMDFWVLITTFVLTTFFGIVDGIMAGVILSLLSVVIRSSKPHFAELGRLPKTISYRNIKRYPEAIVDPKVTILRYDQDLFFANADHFYRSIIQLLEERKTKMLILHLGAINNIDSTAMDKFSDLVSYMRKNQIELIITNVTGPIRDKLSHSKLLDEIGRDRVFLSIADAIRSQNNDDHHFETAYHYASQTNNKVYKNKK